MIDTRSAVNRVNRQLLLGMIIKVALGALLLGALLFKGGGIIAAAVIGAWVGIANASGRISRIVATAEAHLMARHFDEAEELLSQAIASFSISRTPKLLALMQLASLRRTQQRWADCALVCEALLKKRLGTLSPLRKAIVLTYAQALLELDRAAAAGPLLQTLTHERLSLEESMQLLSVQTEFLARAGAWGQIIPDPATPLDHPAWSTLNSRVQLAELMSAQQAARTQALMALAAQKVGQPAWALWLRSRAELLVEWRKLVGERPMLGELWPGVTA